ncbi:SDR family NAD(P)-dependent oxidoreductase [Nocardioides sp. B-3]|uniref:SDR family NAD(P)-dependent oxidoreductase n=1 Tax=Nocardioides sp. B-3 TaxID=2895565 RepID=UPI002152F701|nr:SDR family oxidoreductase [Nocardioides sp. B-3]UUZ59530.1 SDR family oxidoreductase [Nocardioides sp. B-3]
MTRTLADRVAPRLRLRPRHRPRRRPCARPPTAPRSSSTTSTKTWRFRPSPTSRPSVAPPSPARATSLHPDFADHFVGTAVEEFGGLHLIVNNAGYTWDTVVQKMTDEQWDAILDVHLKAPFRILRSAQPVISAAVKAERAAGGPRVTRKVVNISSLAGTAGNAGRANYSAAKAGVVGLTKAMAKEWGRYDVTVNAVAFGLIRTRLTESVAGGDETVTVGDRELSFGVNPELLAQAEASIPLRRAGTPEEAAGAVYLLCLPESDYISGRVLLCAGGFNA